MGNVCNISHKSMKKVLTLEEAKKKREESRNRQHSIDEKILPIPTQQVKQRNSIENTMLDTLEQESKRRNLIVDNTIHSPTTHILVSSSMDGASNTCSSTSKGKAKIPDIEVEEDNATLMEASYGEDENLGALLSIQFCEEFNHYVLDDEKCVSPTTILGGSIS